MISTCLASYNGERFILSQIESILSQLSESDELIISDDSSSDRTVELIKDIQDPRIILFENNQFKSPVFNFEFALKQAKGDYIFLADQDDIWLPQKVEVCFDLLRKYDLVVSDCEIIDGSRKILERSFFKVRNSGTGFLKNILHNSYLGCCMAFRKEILRQALPFPHDIPMHDMWLGLVSEIYGTPHFTSQVLLQYRRHGSNASPTGQDSPYSLFRKMKFRYFLVKNLVALFIKKIIKTLKKWIF
jgi:glycosyltransferase involved in cell wall biosynthesis